MKKYIYTVFILIFFSCTGSVFGQVDKIKLQIDSLKYLEGDAMQCNSLVWRIASNKKDAIQMLIDKLDDTTTTKATNVCKKANLRVGDLAYLSLGEMIALPFFSVTGIQLYVMDENGCQIGKFEYIESNRKKFKQQVHEYCNNNKAHIKWMESEDFMLTPCQIENNLHGHYYIPD